MANNQKHAAVHIDARSAKRLITPRRTSSPDQSFFETAAVGIGRFTPDGRWIEANPGLCRMLGYSRNDLLKKTIEEITHPDDWPYQKKLLEKIVSGEEDSCCIDKRYICRSTLHLWVSETTSAVRDDAGSYLYNISLIEVNKHKRTEKLFHLALESSLDAMAIADQKGKIALVNSRAQKMFGYRRSELLGQSIEALLPDLLRVSGGRPFGKLQIELMEGKWDSQGRRKDGTFFPAEIGARAIETGQGTWTVNSIADLSEHKQAEAKLDVEVAS